MTLENEVDSAIQGLQAQGTHGSISPREQTTSTKSHPEPSIGKPGRRKKVVKTTIAGNEQVVRRYGPEAGFDNIVYLTALALPREVRELDEPKFFHYMKNMEFSQSGKIGDDVPCYTFRRRGLADKIGIDAKGPTEMKRPYMMLKIEPATLRLSFEGIASGAEREIKVKLNFSSEDRDSYACFLLDNVAAYLQNPASYASRKK